MTDNQQAKKVQFGIGNSVDRQADGQGRWQSKAKAKHSLMSISRKVLNTGQPARLQTASSHQIARCQRGAICACFPEPCQNILPLQSAGRCQFNFNGTPNADCKCSTFACTKSHLMRHIFFLFQSYKFQMNGLQNHTIWVHVGIVQERVPTGVKRCEPALTEFLISCSRNALALILRWLTRSGVNLQHQHIAVLKRIQQMSMGSTRPRTFTSFSVLQESTAALGSSV